MEGKESKACPLNARERGGLQAKGTLLFFEAMTYNHCSNMTFEVLRFYESITLVAPESWTSPFAFSA